MKKIRRACLVFAVLLTLCFGINSIVSYGAEPGLIYGGYRSAGDLWVVGCNESISLRAEPSTSSRALMQIPLYARVTCYNDIQNGFIYVNYNGNYGYALLEYLDEYEPQIAIGQNMKVVNCRESITLRTSPSTSAAGICQIPLGANVYVFQEAANGFYKVQYNGHTGYALSRYLKYFD